MPDKLPVVFIWHQHQPGYNTFDTPSSLPWTRLHLIKDYIPFLLFSKRNNVPWVINFTPVLLDQIRLMAQETPDMDFLFCQKDASEFSQEDRQSFCREWIKRIDVPMYSWSARLPELAEILRNEVELSNQDFTDFVAIINLTWMRRLGNKDVACLCEKGSGYTFSDLVKIAQIQQMSAKWFLDEIKCQCDNLELITSPYAHPIIPLLISSKAGQTANPHVNLPNPQFSYPDDAKRQIMQGLELFSSISGITPSGFWPSEMSVDSESLNLFQKCGIRWIVADEAILTKTFGVCGNDIKSRLPYYKMYDKSGVKVFFRDRFLSDLIGFEYSRMDEEQAAKDMVARLEYLSANLPQGSVVTIALDGENCWEFYKNQGELFLSTLCNLLSDHPSIELATPGMLLERDYPNVKMGRIASGSWIYGNFDTWIGHREKNELWEQLTMLRQKWPKNTSDDAWRSLLLAEGSDWFWWMGDDHPSPDKQKFRDIFIGHLKNAAKKAGLEDEEIKAPKH
jgi:alpha-amylase/alpha-mannosidase (GH57 family)